MSKIRIRNNEDQDIVTIDMHDGAVSVLIPEQLDDAARLFWDAVSLIRRRSGDLIFHEPEAPTFTVAPGRGYVDETKTAKGGDVNIYPYPYEPE